jgi:hypothetical protein
MVAKLSFENLKGQCHLWSSKRRCHLWRGCHIQLQLSISFVFDFCAGPRRPATPIYAHHIASLFVTGLLAICRSNVEPWRLCQHSTNTRTVLERVTHGFFPSILTGLYIGVSLEIYCKLCMLVIYRKFIGYRLLCSKGTRMGEFFHSGPRFFSYAC